MAVVLITGATRGIGEASALELAGRGAELAITGRDPARVRATAARLRSAGGAPVHEYVANLELMSGVRALVGAVRERHERIDVLANNAGALFPRRGETAEGLERTFALNHMAPFLLTLLLRDRLAGGRVVTTSSGAHRTGRLDLGDLQSRRGYRAFRVYGTTKLCNILFTRELARRAPELRATCFHPGVVRTGFGRSGFGATRIATTLTGPFLRSPARGARTLVWLAQAGEAAGLSGVYVEDERVAEPSAQAQDDVLAAGLWEACAALAGISGTGAG